MGWWQCALLIALYLLFSFSFFGRTALQFLCWQKIPDCLRAVVCCPVIFSPALRFSFGALLPGLLFHLLTDLYEQITSEYFLQKPFHLARLALDPEGICFMSKVFFHLCV